MIIKWLKKEKKRLLASRFFLFVQECCKNKKHIKNNFSDFTKEEKREVKELLQNKQSFKKYCKDSSDLFRDYFIPNDNNDNRPKILRPKQLTIIAIFLLFLKVSLIGYIFLVYQEKAEMSANLANQVFTLTNESRIANGVEPLNYNSYLNQAAQLKAEDMLINNYFSHTSPDGRKPWNFVNRNLYPYLLVGENLAMNFIASNDVHTALMASPSHQKNILNPKYTDIGLFVTTGSIDGKETNILVQIFAYKKELEPVIVIEDDADQIIIDSPVESNDALVLGLSGEEEVPEKVVEILESSQEVLSSEQVVDVISIEPVTVIPDATDTSIEEDISNIPVIPLEITEEEFILETTEIIDNNLNEEVTLIQEPVEVVVDQNKDVKRAVKVMDISKVIYVVFLLFLIIVLIINIVVRVTVQHKSVIIRTILLLILIAALLLFDFNFMDKLRDAGNSIILF